MTIGYAIYVVCDRSVPNQRAKYFSAVPRLLILVLILSILPDVDSVQGLLSGEFGRFHNNATHSLIVGFAMALFLGAVNSWKRWAPFWSLFIIALFAYVSHVIMDAFTISRGVMAFWPISSVRILSPVSFFYGFHWSDGLLSWQHLITLVTEVAFGIVVIILAYWLQLRR